MWCEIKNSNFSNFSEKFQTFQKSFKLLKKVSNFSEKFQIDWPITWLNGEVSMPMIAKKSKMEFMPNGLLQFMNEGKKYNVVDGSYAFSEGTNDDEEIISFMGESDDSKVKVEFISRHSGSSELLVTEQ